MDDTQTIEEVIGRNLSALRAASGMTMEELGAALGSYLPTGWKKQAVYSAERGGRSFTTADMLALTQVLGCTLAQLVRADGPVALGGQMRLSDEDVSKAASRSGRASDSDGWDRFVSAAEVLNDLRLAAARYENAIEGVRHRVAENKRLQARIESAQDRGMETTQRELQEIYDDRHEAGERPPRTRDVIANASPLVIAANDA